MGVGKSTVGPLLAQALGLGAIDLDTQIVEHTGMTITALFAQRGEDGFRAVERTLIHDSCLREPHVLSLGGGALHTPGNLAQLRTAFDVVVLTASLPNIRARLSNTARSTRPLWSDVESLYWRRQPGYRAAGPNIDTDQLAPHQVVERILEVLAA